MRLLLRCAASCCRGLPAAQLVGGGCHTARRALRIHSAASPQQRLETRIEQAQRASIPPIAAVPDLPDLSTPTGVTLRPYQRECLDAVTEALADGKSRLGVSSPTGSGKTTIFAELIARIRPPTPRQARVLILVTSIQIAQQVAAHVVRRYPDLWVEIEQGSKNCATGHADVTVATWQTLVSRQRAADDDLERLRLEKFDPQTFKAVIVDEAHHAVSRSYRVILNHFDERIVVDPVVLEGDAENTETKAEIAIKPSPSSPIPPIIGFSATFSRHDGLALGAVFDEIVFHRDVLDLIGDDWLSPLRFTSVKAEIPLDNVKVGESDFTTTSLASVINTEPINRLIVRTWLAKARRSGAGRKLADGIAEPEVDNEAPIRTRTLVFAVNIQHVHDLADAFRAAGIEARSLTGTTPLNLRDKILDDFSKGLFPVLVNCAILTEGADIPAIDCVLLARPTLSRNLFSQMIGRGMRLSPATDKKDCLILDLVGNCSKGLICSPTLFGLNASEAVQDMDTQEMLDRRQERLESKAEELTEEGVPKDPAWGRPYLAEGVRDPTKVTFTDWSSAASLQEAMASKALFNSSVEAFTPLAWIDCGDDVYVVEVPFDRGFVRVERQDPAAALEANAKGTAAKGKGTAAWVSTFVAKIKDRNEAMAIAAARRGGPWRPANRAVFRAARQVLEADSLEQAIRGSDTYIGMHLVESPTLMRTIMSRYASWRSQPASVRQQAWVEKKLGLMPGGRLKVLTRGEVSNIVVRLSHGAKTRWARKAKAQARVLANTARIEERQEKETVRVGKLAK